MSAAEDEVITGRPPGGPWQIGRYVITRELGRGSTSRVYLAHDPDLGGDVALKLYHDDSVRPERARTRRKLFANEGVLVGKLVHPNIARVLDSGEDGGRPYVACEYLSGAKPLSAHTRLSTLLPQRRVVEILFACAKALDYAHGLGVIHRDIKPSNVLITSDGIPKLLDCGIAVMSFTGTQTVTGLVGSPSYMAPEQVRDGTATVRSDVYSLGVMGYELLSARRPFYGENLSHLVHQIIYATPRPLSRLRASVPAELEAVVAQAMEKDPERRFPNALAMAARLAWVLDAFNRDSGTLDQHARFDFLRYLPLFQDFGYSEVWEVASRSEWRSYDEGEAIVTAGSHERALFVVVSGEVVVERKNGTIRRLHRGQFFGELNLVSAHARMPAVRAATPAELMRFDVKQLEAISTTSQLAFHKLFNRMLVHRLERSKERAAKSEK
ncbi:MAG: serine/threonine-protein kinase [Gammaproteobacteria bacterium]